MPLFKKHLTPVIILLSTAFFICCTSTITKRKDPVFNIEISSVQTALNKIVICENINLAGKEITTDGKVTSELEVSIVNGQSIPTDEDQMKDLGKLIAWGLKKSLKDQNEYNKYIVLFVTKVTDGGVTKRNWKGNEFKSEELQGSNHYHLEIKNYKFSIISL